MAMRHRIVIGLVLMTIVTTMAGCGGKDEDPGRAATPKPAAADGAQRADQAAAARDARRPANAVTTGEAARLSNCSTSLHHARRPGRRLRCSWHSFPKCRTRSTRLQRHTGTCITSAESVRFADVLAGRRYTTEVMIVGDLPGLYYIGVVARMAWSRRMRGRSRCPWWSVRSRCGQAADRCRCVRLGNSVRAA